MKRSVLKCLVIKLAVGKIRYLNADRNEDLTMSQSKRNKKWIPFAAAAVAVCCIFAGNKWSVRAKTQDDKIAKGVYIGNVNVGGMTKEQAESAVSDYEERIDNAVFTLNANGKSVEIKAEELGITLESSDAVKQAFAVGRTGNLIERYKEIKDLEYENKVFELPLRINETAAKEVIETQAETLNEEAVDNGLVRKNGKFEIIEGAVGTEVNIEKSLELIEDYLKTEWDGENASIDLAAETVEPRGKKEDLEKVKDLLGSFSTNYSSSAAGRCANISIATERIDGTVLYPGEEFSVAQTVGPLTKAGGYELAGAYENGQTVQAYGGGVCQVSTTLYDAVLNAELEITQRSNHSMIVTYVKPAMDAAIAGDYKDLKFVNNLDTPIYIEGYTSGKNLYFNIYGEETRPSNRKVTYESEVVSEDNPATQFVATGSPIGSISTAQNRRTGYTARLWKVVTVDGVEQSREAVNKSTYRSTPKIVHVGTASPDPNATAAVNAAIATGNEAAIYAAVNQYQNAAAPSTEPTEPETGADTTEQTPVENTPQEAPADTSLPQDNSSAQPQESVPENTTEGQ